MLIKLSNMRLGLRLGLGFLFIIVINVANNLYAKVQMENMAKLTEKLYDHPYTVSTALLRIDGDIVRMHRSMKDVALAKTTQQMQQAQERVAGYERDVYRNFDIVEDRFLGNKADVAAARQAFSAWKPIRDEVIALMQAGKRVEAAAITKGKGAAHVSKMNQALKGLIDFASSKAAIFIENAHTKRQDVTVIAYLLLALAIVVATLLAVALTRSVVGPVSRSVDIANRIAAGELDNDIEVVGRDESAALMAALKQMNDNLRGIVNKVRNSSSTVNHTAREIAAGNINLSQRTEEQAASLEQTASSIEELTATVRQNADNAAQANQLAGGAQQKAEAGGAVVRDAVAAMEDIENSSKQIAAIIGVIDEIAFQTNLLALNAAVEAARAGDQGRGFAVVAGEVRNLAQRSAGAAREIKDLITASVDKVRTGSILVSQSGTTLKEIVTAVKRVTDVVGEIAAASQEQASGIDEINRAVSQMDQITQQNASLVEQAAAASRTMEEEAQTLVTEMQFFKLSDSTPRPRRDNETYSTAGAAPALVAARVASPLPAPRNRNTADQCDDQWEAF